MEPLTMAALMGGSAIFETLLNQLFGGVPKDVRMLTKEAAAKGRQLLAKPGFEQSTLDAIFGKGFENIRAQGRAVREQRTGTLGRAGMLGTGAEVKGARKDVWSNEALVTEAMRDLLITGEAKKSADIQLASQLLGQSAGAAQTQQGQGPALTDVMLSSILMGMRKPALDDSGMSSLLEEAMRGFYGLSARNYPTSFQSLGFNPVGY